MKSAFVPPSRLREMAEKITCPCEIHRQTKRGLLEMAYRAEASEKAEKQEKAQADNSQ